MNLVVVAADGADWHSKRVAITRPFWKGTAQLPGFLHNVRIRAPGRCRPSGVNVIEAVFNGQVIAASEDTVVLEGSHYVPPADSDPRFLDRTLMHSLCPWKGVASYYTLEVAGCRGAHAAWTYRHPSALARPLKNLIAFYGILAVRAAE